MSSELWVEVKKLLDDTEQNLKRIEVLSDDYLVPILNEWRYATRHIVDAHFSGDEEGLSNSIRHLRRARYDSFDVLLSFQIERIQNYKAQFSRYIDTMEKYVPKYADWQVRIKKAMRFLKLDYTAFNKESMYDDIRRACLDMDEYLEIIEATEEDWVRAIRKEKLKDFWSFVLGVVTIIGTAATVCGIFLNR